MTTTYRCVCPTCTGFISSWTDPDPEEWGEECKEFLSGPCPHQGDGYERYSDYRLFVPDKQTASFAE